MLVFCHRGASGYTPENTISAFKKSMEYNAQHMEFDVQITKDRQFVVCHDENLERLANKDVYVKDLTYDELKKLDVGIWFGSEYQNEYIPLFEEVLQVITDNIFLNVEIKDIGELSNVIEFKRIIDKYKDKNYLISSFKHDYVKEMIALDEEKEYKYGLLYDSNADMSQLCEDVTIESINISIEDAKEELIDKIHKMGYKVYVYTVNDKSTALKLQDLKVDGVFSNYPDLLR